MMTPSLLLLAPSREQRQRWYRKKRKQQERSLASVSYCFEAYAVAVVVVDGEDDA